MIEVDFAFGSTTEKDIAKATINAGYVRPEMVSNLHQLVHGKEFQSIARLLIIMSDRTGRTEERKEDSYARFSTDFTQFVDRLYKEAFPKKDKNVLKEK